MPYGRIPINFLIGSRGRRRRHRPHLFFCDPTISKAKRQYKVCVRRCHPEAAEHLADRCWREANRDKQQPCGCRYRKCD
jgi:hypothetical protein